jgi:hypothetical protein
VAAAKMIAIGEQMATRVRLATGYVASGGGAERRFSFSSRFFR